jgi:hypothetical protein
MHRPSRGFRAMHIQVAMTLPPIPTIRILIFFEEIATADESSN